MIGNIVLAIAFVFVGPLSFLDIEPQVGIIQGVLVMVGLGYAMIGTSSFCRAHAAAIKLGYQDNISTYIMISGKCSNNIEGVWHIIFHPNKK